MRKLLEVFAFAIAGVCLFLSPLHAQQIVWQNPTPFSNNLNSVCFIDSLTGWAVGERGAVTHTTDGGAHWLVQESSIPAQLSAVSFFNARRGWAAGSGYIISTTDGGAHWIVPPDFPLSDLQFTAIAAVDSLNVWVCGTQILFHSSDGGTTWSSVSLPAMANFYFLLFTSPTVGWLGGDALLLKTTDAGLTWTDSTNIPGLHGVTLTDMKLSPPGNLWLTETWFQYGWEEEDNFWEINYVWKSKDGGSTWSQTLADSAEYYDYWPGNTFRGFVFSDSTHGYFDSGIGAFSTTDGGATWDSVVSGKGAYAIGSANSLFAVGGSGYIAKSTNMGAAWKTQSSGPTDNIVGVQFFSPYVGYAGGGTAFLRTTDGGAHWIPRTNYFAGLDLLGFQFRDSLNGWAISTGLYYESYGSILTTSNGGVTWTPLLDTTAQLNFNAIDFPDVTHGYVSTGTSVLATSDSGRTWHTTALANPNEPLAALAFRDSLDGIASGYGLYTYATTNGGKSWDSVRTVDSLPYVYVNSVAFVGGNSYVAVCSQGLIQKSTDGGQSWLTKFTASTSLWDVQFLEGEFGTAVGDGGAVVTTSDGGESWRQLGVAHAPAFSAVWMSDPAIGWFVGAKGTIIHARLPNTVLGVLKRPRETPASYGLAQNYPNPFNPSTNIQYSLPVRSPVRLEVFNVLGQRVALLADETQNAGEKSIDWNAASVASGVYFYRLTAGAFVQTKKLILLR